MTAEYPPTKPAHGDSPEEQPPTPESGDVERETPSTSDGMSQGKNYPSAPPENQAEFDPASTRAPQGGGPD